MALFTTTSGLYGGVLWSGELQGFVIIHETVPSQAPSAKRHAPSARTRRGRVVGVGGEEESPLPVFRF
jgi:hypothetical protein